jgi:hypothetical protein
LNETTMPEDMRDYELPAGEETLIFHGRFLDGVDTDSDDRFRWAELRLYKIVTATGDQAWLLYTIGHSLVYHAANGCSKGVKVRVGDFGSFRTEDEMDDLEPCAECNPRDWRVADEADVYRLEITWYSYTVCPTADKVLESLYRERRCANCRQRCKPHDGEACWKCGCGEYSPAPRTLSVPGRRLIEQVKAKDPEIAKAVMKVRRL